MDYKMALFNTSKKRISRLFLFTLVLVGMLLGTMPVGAAPFAYVTNAFAPSVSVIDTADSSVRATVAFPLGSVPFAIAITPDGKHAYVTTLDAFTTGGGGVSLVDTASNTIVGNQIIAGSEPTGIAITPDGKHAYVANRFMGVSR